MEENNIQATMTPTNEVPAQPQPQKVVCKYCGHEMQSSSAFCPSCGKSQSDSPAPQPEKYSSPTGHYTQNNTATTVIVDSGRGRSNGIGTAGFVLSLIAFFVCWIPGVDFVVWFLGALFSFIGVFRKPRGLAIAGLVISFLGIITILCVLGLVLGFASML